MTEVDRRRGSSRTAGRTAVATVVAVVTALAGLVGVGSSPAGAEIPAPQRLAAGGEVAWDFDPSAYFTGFYGTITPTGGATEGSDGRARFPVAGGTVDPVTGAARLELTGALTFTSALYGVSGATLDDIVVVLPASGDGFVEADRTGPTAASATVRTTVATLSTSTVTPTITAGSVDWTDVAANGVGGNAGALQAGAAALGPLTATIEVGDGIVGAITVGSGAWNVRESLQRYVGDVTATPPATGVPVGPGTQRFTFPAQDGGFFDTESGTTYLPLGGAVVFDKPSYCFRITITDPAIVISPTDAGIYGSIETYIYPSCPAALPGAQTVSGEGRIFSLGLDGITPTVANGVTTWSTIPVSLTDVGAPFFAGFYGPGEPFDPISFSYEGDGGLPVQAEEALTPPGTPVYGQVDATADLGRVQIMPLVNPLDGNLFSWADGTTLTDLDPATLDVDSTSTFGPTHQYIAISPVTGRIVQSTQGAVGKPWLLDRAADGTYTRHDLNQQTAIRNTVSANGTIYGTTVSQPTIFSAVTPTAAAATAPLDPASYTSVAWSGTLRVTDSMVADADGTIVVAQTGGNGVATVDLTTTGGVTTGATRTVPGTTGATFVAMGRSGTIYAGSGTTVWKLAEDAMGYVVDGAPIVLEQGIRGYAISDSPDGSSIFAVHRRSVSVIRGGVVVSTFPLTADASVNKAIDVAPDGTVYIAAGNQVFAFAVVATSPALDTLAPTTVSLGVGQTSAPATFGTTATGSPAPTFQWQRRQAGTSAWTDIAGATGATLTIDARPADDGTEVRATATNDAGTTATPPALLTVKSAPSVLRQPDPLALVVGDSGSVSLDGAGNPQPTVQWQRRSGGFWVDIAGATGASFTVDDANLDQDGTLLRAVLTNEVATVVSQSVRLTVTERTTETAYVVDGDLDWGVRQSFRNYISGPIAKGAIEVGGGATRNADGTFRFPAAGGTVVDGAVDASFGGTVRFTGHEGVGTPPGVPALDVLLDEVRIEVDGDDGRLVADVTSRGLESGAVATYDDVTFADLDLSGISATPVDGGLRWAGVPATLTEAGVPAFADFYEAGSALDPLSFTLVLDDEAPAARTAAESFVTGAWVDFTGADPTVSQLAGGVATVNANGKAAFLRDLSTSDAWLSGVVNDLYRDTLGRDGDAAGVAFWIGRLRGGWTVARVAASFYASPEYHAGIGGGTDATWVEDLYEKVLLRPADASGRDYWVAEVVAKGRGNVALRMYQSNESARTRVRVLYDALLGRAAEADGLAYWAGVVVRRGDLALAVSLAGSAEYQARTEVRFP